MRIALLQQKTPQTSTEETLRRLSDIIERHNPDVVIGPEYLFVAPPLEGWDWDKKKPTYTPRIFDKKEKRSLEQKLQMLSAQKDTLLIPGTLVWTEEDKYRNSCSIFHRGNKIREIQKEFCNGADRNYAPHGVQSDHFDTLFLTSPLSHQRYLRRHLFQFRGRNYVVEICDDHCSQARRVDIGDPPPQVADMQIVVSHSVHHHFPTPRTALIVREGGVVIECNGYYPTSFIGQISKNRISTLYNSCQPAPDKVQVIEVAN